MNARDAWKGLNVMMSRNTYQQLLKCPDPVKFVNEINTFYVLMIKISKMNVIIIMCQYLDPPPVTGHSV